MHPLADFARLSRREFFTTAAGGLGGLALAALLAQDGVAVEPTRDKNPLAPKPPHFPPKAKNCIFIFLSGGTSQVDLFDPKPMLNELSGKPVPEKLLEGARFAFIQKDSARLLASPRTFAKHGQCGMDFCDLLPHVATCADDILMVRSMWTQPFNHHPATIMMNSGFERMGRPTIGSWLTYGLGNAARDLPGYVVLEPGPGIRGGATNWSGGFMPSTYAGVQFHLQGEPVKNLTPPPGLPRDVERLTLDTLAQLNERRFKHITDPEITSRVASYELAFRMQQAAPELLDLSKENPKTREAYGVGRKDRRQHDFSLSCLLARRMVERGVRFVNIYMDGWDHHGGLDSGLVSNCAVVDQPIAALVHDLKQRGLLDSTLVVWGTEFGRTPLGDNRIGMTTVTGRDHHPNAFTIWMAGGGLKGGLTYGATDEIGWTITENPVHINDLHATLLHLFGLNHEVLTYRFEGRDYRLTDVAGRVVKGWLT
jgi:hypothetical protein